MKVDLHIHSNFSDGKYAPAKIVEYAIKNGLRVIALTDHDTIGGLSEAEKIVQKLGTIQFVAGVELTTSLNDDELHILGYGIDATHPGLLDYMAVTQANRQKRIGRILKQLAKIGIILSVDDVKNGFNTLSFGRMHVAHTLVKHGYVQTIREAFDRYLNYETKLIEPSPGDFMAASQAVSVILEAGGIPVLAHPTIKLFDRCIDALIGYGLGGVEVFKESRTAIEEFYLETVVKDKGLLLTGGSDWHGYHATRNLGSFYVESEQVQAFLKAVRIY